MNDHPIFEYTVEQLSTGVEFGKFQGNGDVDDYPEPYRTMARNADSGAAFTMEIDGTTYTGLVVRVEEVHG